MSAAVARKALKKLLASAERARTAGRAERGLLFSQVSFPDYFQHHSVAELAELHSELESAARAGAIKIEWDRRSGDRGQVVRLDIRDAEALAGYLQVTPLWQLLQQARARLAPWTSRPQVERLLESWERGKRPRERGPESVEAVVQAMQVIDAVNAQPKDTMVAVRRLSAQLFQDSKRIEGLYVELDLLTRLDEGPSRTADEIYAELGLQRFPMPFTMASASGGRYRNTRGHSIPVEVPYTALDPSSVQGFELAGRYVLSVENWTVFSELAQGNAGPIEGLLLYSAGMPSPRWLQAYRRILQDGKPAQVLHWGDPDIGGIRAMKRISAVAREAGLLLQPFAMDEEVPGRRKEFSDDEVAYICRMCTEPGWNGIAEMVTRLRGAIEQESQRPRLPT